MDVRSSRARFRTPRGSRLTFAQAIARMRRGATLSLQYIRNKPLWELDSFYVAPEVAAVLADCAEVVAANDSLILGLPGHTWWLKTK